MVAACEACGHRWLAEDHVECPLCAERLACARVAETWWMLDSMTSVGSPEAAHVKNVCAHIAHSIRCRMSVRGKTSGA